jgi:hypothetical protein
LVRVISALYGMAARSLGAKAKAGRDG